MPESISQREQAAIIRVDENADLVNVNWEVIESETWFCGHLGIEICFG